jgi:hypothetical protein
LPPVSLVVEAAEKVPNQIPGRNAEESDLIECAPINDLTPRKGQETPENTVLTRQKDFPTGSLGFLDDSANE